jgi:hypothetical protein
MLSKKRGNLCPEKIGVLETGLGAKLLFEQPGF